MRWLLQELAASGGRDAIGAGKHEAELAHRAKGGAVDLMTSVADAAGRASEVASNMASDVGSELASNVASRARATTTLDSATALPRVEAATAGGHGADAMDLDGAGAGKQHLQPPHGLWHGHGPILLLLVAVHLAAFLYWIYLYVISRKFEARKSEHARRVVKPFKVVYEWGLDVSASITSVMRKKQAQSPSASPRIALTSMPSPKPPGLQRSSSGFSLNKLIKGRAA